MKTNKQKGFIVSVLIAIVAVFIIGCGAYIYTNKKVEAPVVVPSLPVAITNQTSTSTDVTKDWKTYSNYGFQIQYPSANNQLINDMDITGGRNITFAGGHGDLMVEIVTQAWYDGVLKAPANCNDFDSNVITSHATINGVDFIKGDVSSQFSGMNSASSVTEYCILQNGTAYKIIPRITYGHGAYVNVNNDSELNKMLATFKFTNSSCVAGRIINGVCYGSNDSGQPATYADVTKNWKTYTNTQYGFEFQYPTNAKIEYQDMTDRNDQYIGLYKILETGSFYKVVYLLKNQSDLSADDYVKKVLSNLTITTSESIQVNNFNGKKVYALGPTEEGNEGWKYFLFMNNLVLEIPFIQTANKDDSLKSYENFVNSFKFTN